MNSPKPLVDVPTQPADLQVSGRGSLAVRVLEAAWTMLSQLDPVVPPAVLTLVDVRSRRRILGYFARSIWQKRAGAAHEIAISPELLGNPAELFGTMVHEAAHAVLYEAGENAGVGNSRYYHTAKFRDECVRMGLECHFYNCRYGWTNTSWPVSGAPEKYRAIIAMLQSQLPPGTGLPPRQAQRPRKLPPPGQQVLACSCAGGARTIYVKKSVNAAGGILCTFCNKHFLPIASSHRTPALT